jgi:DNA-directed RNA polymerase subunit H
MSLSNNKIVKIYKSRKTILELLKSLDYAVSDYDEFSINEIDAMVSNDQLDMLLENEKTKKKVYIKYYANAKNLRKENLDTLIEDLFVLESILTKEDTLIIVVNEEPNDTITERIKYLYDHDQIFIVMHNIERLQFNILEHHLVPEIRILDGDQLNELMEKYSIKDKTLLPNISRFDPQALAVCLRPGQVCQLKRKSNTAMDYFYYRVCI